MVEGGSMSRYIWFGRDIGYYLAGINERLKIIQASLDRIEAGAGSNNDAALNRAADQLDTSSARLEKSISANTPPAKER